MGSEMCIRDRTETKPSKSPFFCSPNVGDLLSARLMLSAGQKDLNVLLERVKTTKLLF